MFGRKKEELVVTISNKTILRIIAFGVGTFAAFRFFDNIRHPLTLIFVSFFLSMTLNPAVSYITKKLKSKSRTRGTAVAYLIVMTALISFFSFVIPPLVRQSTVFVQSIPDKIRSLETQDSSIGRFVRKNNLNRQLTDLANDVSNNIGEVSGPVLTTANRVLSAVVSFVTVLVLTFMMLIEGPYWKRKFLDSLPKNRQKHASILMGKMYNLVTSFVNAQLVVALIGAFFAMIALTIASKLLDVSINPVALAGLVALFGIIPTIGGILSAGVVALACLFTSGTLALVMLVYFVIYQQIENVTIQPYIQSRNNDMSPMLVFIAALLGIGFGGLLGGFVAIPAAGCIKILVEDYLDDRRLNSSKD